VRTTDDARALRLCIAQPGVSDAREVTGGVRFTAAEPVVAELSVALVEAGLALLELVPEAASLEELFFRLTEGADADAAGNGSPAPSATTVGEAP
jgi:ABC-2 type transport system ATP-binding protein